jgi:hypothetical protein
MKGSIQVVLLKKNYLFLILVVVHLRNLNYRFQKQVAENFWVLENIDPRWVVVTRQGVEVRETREMNQK